MLHQVIKNKLTNKKELIPITGLGDNGNSIQNTLKILELQDIIAGGLVYNTEEVITESDEWTAPVEGWYDVTLINGGNGGVVKGISSPVGALVGGASGAKESFFVYFHAGEHIAVSIGAGGLGGTAQDSSTPASSYGGITTFGDLSVEADNTFSGERVDITLDAYRIVFGGGEGGGKPVEAGIDATYWGGGGGAVVRPSGSVKKGGNGYQGAVIVRYYDPAKNNGSSNNESSIITIFNDILNRLSALEEKIDEVEGGGEFIMMK